MKNWLLVAHPQLSGRAGLSMPNSTKPSQTLCAYRLFRFDIDRAFENCRRRIARRRRNFDVARRVAAFRRNRLARAAFTEQSAVGTMAGRTDGMACAHGRRQRCHSGGARFRQRLRRAEASWPRAGPASYTLTQISISCRYHSRVNVSRLRSISPNFRATSELSSTSE